MIPPTPTPQPTGVEYFPMPEGISLWGATDFAIQIWNWMGVFAMVAQVIVLIVMVWAAIRLCMMYFNEFIHWDANK